MTSAAQATSISLRADLDEGLQELPVTLSAKQRDQLIAYVLLLDKWNRVYNLTAVREPGRMIGLHLLDSLAVLPHLGAGKSLLDVGTGGGLPGIPLAIAQPALAVTMLDTIAKKTTFVRQAIAELGLGNAIAVTARVEEFKPVEKFDIVISRAFAELKDFVDSAANLCADDGRLIAMKGVYPHDEIARVSASVRVQEVVPLSVPQVDGKRHLVLLQKT